MLNKSDIKTLITDCLLNYYNVLKSKVLTKDNIIEYTPTEDYHPVTKKYVDDTIEYKEDLIVDFTSKVVDSSLVWSCDKTYDEILEAINLGRLVRYLSAIGYVISDALGTTIVFPLAMGANYICYNIKSDNTVTRTSHAFIAKSQLLQQTGNNKYIPMSQLATTEAINEVKNYTDTKTKFSPQATVDYLYTNKAPDSIVSQEYKDNSYDYYNIFTKTFEGSVSEVFSENLICAEILLEDNKILKGYCEYDPDLKNAWLYVALDEENAYVVEIYDENIDNIIENNSTKFVLSVWSIYAYFYISVQSITLYKVTPTNKVIKEFIESVDYNTIKNINEYVQYINDGTCTPIPTMHYVKMFPNILNLNQDTNFNDHPTNNDGNNCNKTFISDGKLFVEFDGVYPNGKGFKFTINSSGYYGFYFGKEPIYYFTILDEDGNIIEDRTENIESGTFIACYLNSNWNSSTHSAEPKDYYAILSKEESYSEIQLRVKDIRIFKISGYYYPSDDDDDINFLGDYVTKDKDLSIRNFYCLEDQNGFVGGTTIDYYWKCVSTEDNIPAYEDLISAEIFYIYARGWEEKNDFYKEDVDINKKNGYSEICLKDTSVVWIRIINEDGVTIDGSSYPSGVYFKYDGEYNEGIFKFYYMKYNKKLPFNISPHIFPNNQFISNKTLLASGDYSHAEGFNNIVSGKYSHVEGIGNIASGEHQHVEGKYNIEDTKNKYIHIAGNGFNNSRSNAHTLDWNGNAWFAGDIYIGGTGQDDINVKTIVTEDYVDNKVAGLVNSAPETLDTLNELAQALGNDANFATTVTNSLANKADKEHIHNQYLTEHQSLEGYATEEYVDSKNINIVESEYNTTYTSINKYPYSDLIVSDSFIYIYPSTSPTFSIRLKEKPLNNQIVNLSCNNSIMSLSSTSLTFTEENYNTPQTVTLTLTSTNDIDGDQFIVSVTSEHYYKDITFEYHNEEADSNIISYDFLNEVSDGVLVNVGTGGSKYNATINTSLGNTAEFTSKGLSLHNNAYISIPWTADSSSGSWTVEMVISELVYGGSNTYGRVYRSDTDTPSMYYSKTLGWRVKIDATKALTSSTDAQYIVDKTIVLKYDNGTCSVKVGDDEYISNSMSIENTGFYIGNNDSSKSYYFDTLTISEFRVYNYAK